MHKPSQTHLSTVKRLLRYLKGTLYYGLHLRHASSMVVTTYFDVDLVANLDDRSNLHKCLYGLSRV